MKVFLFICGWLWFLLAVGASLVAGSNAILLGTAAISWVACFVALGSAAICHRLDMLTAAAKSHPPAAPAPPAADIIPGLNDT